MGIHVQCVKLIKFIFIVDVLLSSISHINSQDVIKTSYESVNYLYGVDDGARRYACPSGTWRQNAGGDNTQRNYNHPSGVLVVYVLKQNNYTFGFYTLTCVKNGVDESTLHLNIIDARKTVISYTTPQYSTELTSASSTVAIPPLTQDITISCAIDGCTWGGRERPLISDYTINVMTINENAAISSYYNYYTNATDSIAGQYELLQFRLQTTGSAFAIKLSDTSYTIQQPHSKITASSDTLLACATDRPGRSNIIWYYTRTDNIHLAIIISDEDERLSLNTTTGISTLLVAYNNANSGLYACRVNVNNGSTDVYSIFITFSIPVTPITITTTTPTTTTTTLPTTTTTPTATTTTPTTTTTPPTTTTLPEVLYIYHYGVDDGATRYLCYNGTWRQDAGGDDTQRYYTHPSGVLVVFVLKQNNYIFDIYTLTCVRNGVDQSILYLIIRDATKVNISYSAPQYTAEFTGASSTVAIPPLAQNITISCVTDGCTWGGRERPLILDYTISVMNINVNAAITNYYNYYTDPTDTIAGQYDLQQVTLQTNGSTFALKHSDTSYTILQSNSFMNITSGTLLACATDMTENISINWYSTSSNGEMQITDARVSLNTTTGISTLLLTYSSTDRGNYICKVTVNSGDTDEYAITIYFPVSEVLYSYYYGVDDGDTRMICYHGIWRQDDGGDNTQRYYTHPSGVLIVNVLKLNNYIFDFYILTCVRNGVAQNILYLNIIDARVAVISYSAPQYTAELTGASSTVTIPPLAQNITISCVTDGCTWGGRERPLIPDYTISVMNINENTAVTNYYNYYTDPTDTVAEQYDLLQATLQTIGSAFAIKLSDTSYTIQQSSSSITVSSDTLLACATDMIANINITWYYTSAISSANGETIIPDTDARVSLNTTTGISTLLVKYNNTNSGLYVCRVKINSGSTDLYSITINIPATVTSNVSARRKRKDLLSERADMKLLEHE